MENKDTDIEFLEEQHLYLIKGQLVPSATQVIDDIMGNAYGNIPPEILKKSADYGTLVHKDIELGKFETEAGKKWKELTELKGLKPVFNEKTLYYELDNVVIFAGTCDNIMINEKGIYVLCDTKNTSSKLKDKWNLQLNMYRLAIQQRLGITCDYLLNVWLPPKKLEKSQLVGQEIYEKETIEKLREWYKKNH